MSSVNYEMSMKIFTNGNISEIKLSSNGSSSADYDVVKLRKYQNFEKSYIEDDCELFTVSTYLRKDLKLPKSVIDDMKEILFDMVSKYITKENEKIRNINKNYNIIFKESLRKNKLKNILKSKKEKIS